MGGQGLPWGRLGKPEEIARGIAFVLSDDCEYMTGSTFSMEGGASLPWWSNRESGAL